MNNKNSNPLVALLVTVLLTVGGVYLWEGLYFFLIPQFFVHALLLERRDLATLTVLYTAVLLFLFSPFFVLTILLSYVGLGIVGGIVYAKGLSPFKTIMSLTLYYYAKMLIAMSVLERLVGGFDMDVFISMVLENQQRLFPQSALSSEQVVAAIHNSIGAIYFFISFAISVMIYLVFRLISKYLIKQNLQPVNRFKIEGFSWGWFLLFSLGMYVMSSFLTFGDPWINSAMLMVYILFMFNGFATLAYLLGKRSKSWVLGYVVGFLALIFIPLSPILSIVGFLDAGLNLRRLV